MGTFSKMNPGEKPSAGNQPNANLRRTSETIVLDDSDSNSSLVVGSNDTSANTSKRRESTDDVQFLGAQSLHDDDDPNECFIVDDDVNKTVIKVHDDTLDKVTNNSTTSTLIKDSNAGMLQSNTRSTADMTPTHKRLKQPKNRSRTHYIDPLKQMGYSHRLRPMSRRTVLQLMRAQKRRSQNAPAQMETIAEQADIEMKTSTPVDDAAIPTRDWYPQMVLPDAAGPDTTDLKMVIPIDEPYIPLMRKPHDEVIDVSTPETYIPSKMTTLHNPDDKLNDAITDVAEVPVISVENEAGILEDYLIIDDANCLKKELADCSVKEKEREIEKSVQKVELSNINAVSSDKNINVATKAINKVSVVSQPFRRGFPIRRPAIARRPWPMRRRFFDARLQVIILAGDCVQRFEAHEIRRRIVERLGGWFEGPRFNDSALRYERWLQISCADPDSADWLVRQNLGLLNGRQLQVLRLSDAPYRPIASMFFKKTHHHLPRIMELLKMQNFHTGLRIDEWNICRQIEVPQGMQLILNIHVEDIPILMKMDFCVYFELHLIPIRLWNRDRPWGRAPFIV